MLNVLIHFEDGGTLVYEDVRKFGTLELLAPELLDSYFISKKLGPEPTEKDFDLGSFKLALKNLKNQSNRIFSTRLWLQDWVIFMLMKFFGERKSILLEPLIV